LTIANSAGEEREVALTPRVVDWFEGAETESEPLAISALGIACHVQPTIQATVADSPASTADIKPGDQILSARILFKNPQSEEAKEAKGEGVDEPLPVLQDENYESGSVSWLSLANSGQTLDLRDEPALELQLKRDGKVHLVTVPFYTRSDAFSPKRGTILELQKEMRYASSIGEQASSAITATKRSLLGVYTFLGKIGRQVPMTALGGPVTIATQAYERSSEGIGKLLLFLTMLSANLAVINFLPIPMLDGGHMAFLTYEAIRGKPAGEKFVMALQTAGLAFLLMLMAFVFGLDFGLIPRNL
jgi:regulator of sigma E protease